MVALSGAPKFCEWGSDVIDKAPLPLEEHAL